MRTICPNRESFFYYIINPISLHMIASINPMELYFFIGKTVCQRTEKGAAVMASEYLNNQYPDVKGFLSSESS